MAATSLAQVSVTAGMNGPTQTVDAENIGDGSLNLQVSATASWISASVGGSHTCTSGKGTCLPIKIALNTSSLSAGVYAGLVMIYDPNAIDTPQYINVSVQIGSGVPDKMDFSATPGYAASAVINPKGLITFKITGDWLSAVQSGGTPFSPNIPYTVSASAGAMAAGDYTGSLALTGDITGMSSKPETKSIAVTLHVAAPPAATPLAAVGGAVNNANYAPGESLAQGDIVALFGAQLSSGAPAGATKLPLTTNLGNTEVLLNGTAVPIYYVSSTQVDFQIPVDAQIGSGTLQVVSNGMNGNIISVKISKATPRILQLYGTNAGYGVIVHATDPNQTVVTKSAPATIGETLTIYALGFGPTNPASQSGTASPTTPLAYLTDHAMVCFEAPDPFHQSGLCVAPTFAGLTPGLVGLDQINVVVPAASPTGVEVPIYISTDDGNSNVVNIAVQPKK